MAMVNDMRKPPGAGAHVTSACSAKKRAASAAQRRSIAARDRPELPRRGGDVDTLSAGFKMTKRLLDAPALKALQTSDVLRRRSKRRRYPESPARARRYVYHRSHCKMGVNDPFAVVDPK